MKTISQTGRNRFRGTIYCGAQHGFSFVEVMVTLAVLSFGIILIYRSFFISLDYLNHVANRLHAIISLDNRIASAQRIFEVENEIPFGPGEQHETATIHNKNVEFYYMVTSKSVDNLDGIYQLDASFLWDEGRRRPRIFRSVYIVDYK